MALQFKGRLTNNTKLQCTTQCGQCGLYRDCMSPKIQEIGENRKNIMVIRGIPTKHDDENNQPFSGDEYSELSTVFKENNIDLYKDCILMTATACYANHFTNPKGVAASINYCYPNIKKAIVKHKPQVILLLGFDAVKSVIGRKYVKDLNDITLWRGNCIPNQEFDAWLGVSFDPAEMARMNNPDSKKGKNIYKTHNVIWKQDIKKILSHLDKPVPNYKNLEQYCHALNETEALEWIANVKVVWKDMIAKGIPIYCAIDYETTGLKPHNHDFEIYSLSMSYKYKESVAFRWTLKIKQALIPLLTSMKINYIAHNMKYEHVVSQYAGGFTIRNWKYDPMIGSHILDNRKNYTSLKHLAYIYFDVADYSSHIKEYLVSENSYTRNRIFEANEKTVLVYNAQDSLLTFMLAMKQMKVLGLM